MRLQPRRTGHDITFGRAVLKTGDTGNLGFLLAGIDPEKEIRRIWALGRAGAEQTVGSRGYNIGGNAKGRAAGL